jgi:hypothetical protein
LLLKQWRKSLVGGIHIPSYNCDTIGFNKNHWSACMKMSDRLDEHLTNGHKACISLGGWVIFPRVSATATYPRLMCWLPLFNYFATYGICFGVEIQCRHVYCISQFYISSISTSTVRFVSITRFWFSDKFFSYQLFF